MFRLACDHITKTLPYPANGIGEALCKYRIARTSFDISGIASVLRLLGEEVFFDVIRFPGGEMTVEKTTAEWCRQVPRIARAIVSAFGCGHIEHILNDLEGPERTRNRDVVTVLSLVPDIRWLDHDREWFTIRGTKRNRLSNVVRKILSVAPKISVSELRGAIKRVHRLDGFAPPTEVLRAFCSSLSFCEVNEEYIIGGPLDRGDTLGEIEQSLYDVLHEHGSVMSLNALRDECLQRGMNANSFYQYITYSPIICRLVREVYALVGAEVPPGMVEDISQSTVRGSVMVDHGWTDDGRVWICYRLNASNLRTGVFSLPSSLKGIVSGQYFIQSSGTGARSSILAEGERLTGLHRPIAIRGGEADDVIFVTFDLAELSAELRFSEEIGSTNETNAKPLPNIFLATSDPNEAQRSSGITAIDLVGNGKEWHPISTAPMKQDLEVRLEDPFGRYVLLFPCQLLPGQGWINSWLETPLAREPVDWRNWDDASARF
jgi:hypothetical protein